MEGFVIINEREFLIDMFKSSKRVIEVLRVHLCINKKTRQKGIYERNLAHCRSVGKY